MVILGIDYGEKWLGMALSVDGIVETIKMKNEKLKIKNTYQKLKIIRQICQQHQVDKIVMGLPPGSLRKKIQSFALKLRKDLKLTVELWNESLSSQEAIKTMIQAGIRQKKRREKEHSVAAAVILRDYLQIHGD